MLLQLRQFFPGQSNAERDKNSCQPITRSFNFLGLPRSDFASSADINGDFLRTLYVAMTAR
jgi:hypothetical protein